VNPTPSFEQKSAVRASQEVTGQDNGQFLNWLAEKGFTLDDAKRLWELIPKSETLTQDDPQEAV
jgi:hypothetical protein